LKELKATESRKRLKGGNCKITKTAFVVKTPQRGFLSGNLRG